MLLSMKCTQPLRELLLSALREFTIFVNNQMICELIRLQSSIAKPRIAIIRGEDCMNLQVIERMPETTFDEIMDKYVEMNVAHPFMKSNDRSTHIGLDLMLKRSLKRCVDWCQIGKNEYLSAIRESVSDSSHIKALVQTTFTTKTHIREGIDYSYYYEQND